MNDILKNLTYKLCKKIYPKQNIFTDFNKLWFNLELFIFQLIETIIILLVSSFISNIKLTIFSIICFIILKNIIKIILNSEFHNDSYEKCIITTTLIISIITYISMNFGFYLIPILNFITIFIITFFTREERIMNKEEKAYCNLNSSRKGDGVRVAVFEYDINENLMKNPKIKIPIKMEIDNLYNHCEQVCGIILDNKPNVELFVLPETDEGLQWVIDNNIQIASMSLSNCRGNDELEKKLSQRTLILTSAGNQGRKENHFETTSARNEWWCAIGACKLKSGKPIIESFSSWGLGKVFTCGFDGLKWSKDSIFSFYGTSCASPWVLTLMIDFYEVYKQAFNTFPTIKESLNFMRENSEDLGETGKDLKYGYGLLRLPKEYTFPEKRNKQLPYLYYKSKHMVDVLDLVEFCLGKITVVELENNKYKLLINYNNKMYELFPDTKMYTTYYSGEILYQDVETLKYKRSFICNIDFLKEFLDFSYVVKEDKKVEVRC